MGGELLTFVCLLMAHVKLGDVCAEQLDLVERRKNGQVVTSPGGTASYSHIMVLFECDE